MTPQQASPIALLANTCVEQLSQLRTLFQNLRGRKDFGVLDSVVLDELGRLNIWAGNIGALLSVENPISLDYRLRDTPKVSGQIVELLEDLCEGLEEACSIVSGERENRHYSKPDSNLDYDGVLDDSSSGAQQISEIEELLQSVSEAITSLFRISIIIRNATPRDRYSKAAAAVKEPFDERYDIAHVGHKFPKIDTREMQWLKERLGRAITRRRQYLRYCREHHDKFAPGTRQREAMEVYVSDSRLTPNSEVKNSNSQCLDAASDTFRSKPTSTLALTTASTLLPSNLEVAENMSDGDHSQTSYATSVGEDTNKTKIRIIRLEDVQKGRFPFECPYCWHIQTNKRERSWRKHVLSDLRPYVCSFENCDLKMFADRRTWFEHELEVHRLEWRCLFCAHTPYLSLVKFESHIRSRHGGVYIEAQLPALMKASQKSLDRIPASSCPICDDWERVLKEANPHMPPNETLVVTPAQFRQHLGSHMEQLALFAIPRASEEDNEADSTDVAAGINTNDHMDENSRTNSNDWDETTKDPPLHIAAFQGREADVLRLIADGVDINSTGETWGNVIQAAARGGHYWILVHLLTQGAATDDDDDKIRQAPNVNERAKLLLDKYAPPSNVAKKWQDAVAKLRNRELLHAGTSARTVSSVAQKIKYLSKEYDYVFNVEIESGKPVKLPYDPLQPPRDAATLFLQGNNLSEVYVERLTRFISVNSRPPQPMKEGLYDSPTLRLVPFAKEYESLMLSLQNSTEGAFREAYTNVSVLLVFWDGATENSDFKDELDSLSQVLTEIYRYSVYQARLKTDLMKLPQAHVKRFMKDFIVENDGPETLHIVYFMGHSDAGQLSGSQRPLINMANTERQRKLNQMIQNTVHHIMLKDVQADTLEIFDCELPQGHDPLGKSHSRNANHRKRSEYIGSSPVGTTTGGPGKTSFTSAIIWALRSTADQSESFTTLNLMRSLRGAPHFPSNQVPSVLAVSPGDISSIQLKPLLKELTNMPMVVHITAGAHNEYLPMRLKERTIKCLTETIAIACHFEIREIQDILCVKEDTTELIVQWKLTDEDLPMLEGRKMRVHFQETNSREVIIRLVTGLKSVPWESLDYIPRLESLKHHVFQYHYSLNTGCVPRFTLIS